MNDWRLLFLVLLAADLSACHLHTHCAAGAPSALKGGHGLEPGDRVVAKWRAGFFEATVVTVDGKLVTVSWDAPPPQESRVPRAFVAKLDEAPVAARKGGWLLCLGVLGWELCRLEVANGRRLEVTLSSTGARQTLEPPRTAAIPSGAIEGARVQGERALKLASLSGAAGLVPVTAGRPVSQGQSILAKWYGSWWPATVLSSDENGVSIRYPDGAEATLQADEVAPLPKEPARLEPGAVAFCRWGMIYWLAWVESASASTAEVLYSDGSNGRVRSADCLLARP